jgi:1-aminocyclopropane-1-carboxylate deaminase
LHTFFLNFAKLLHTTYAANNFLNPKITFLDFNAIDIQTINAGWLQQKNISLDVARFDKMHELVSGNKWFKLQYYLRQAKAENKTTIATFGGAWSNHIIATAFTAKEAGFKSVGIIRGEEPASLSETLQLAIAFGMKLIYVTREEYRHKQALIRAHTDRKWFWVNEGGYGPYGAEGAADMLRIIETSHYTHIIAAVGTGTMLAGLIQSSTKNQQVIGISSMKANFALEEQVKKLFPSGTQHNFIIFHDYHLGGYGKHPPQLIDFINEVYNQHKLPLDIVYTSKTFYAMKDLAEKTFFEPGSRILMIHSGGLQGNKGLGPQVLAF